MNLLGVIMYIAMAFGVIVIMFSFLRLLKGQPHRSINLFIAGILVIVLAYGSTSVVQWVTGEEVPTTFMREVFAYVSPNYFNDLNMKCYTSVTVVDPQRYHVKVFVAIKHLSVGERFSAETIREIYNKVKDNAENLIPAYSWNEVYVFEVKENTYYVLSEKINVTSYITRAP